MKKLFIPTAFAVLLTTGLVAQEAPKVEEKTAAAPAAASTAAPVAEKAAAPAADGPVTVSFDDAFDSEISSEIGDLGPGGAAGGEGSGGRDDRGGRGGRDRGPRRHR